MPVAVTILFSMTIGLGTAITFASSHWLLAWMGLEVSTLAVIPLMSRHHHPRATEAALKYFVVQATGTSLLLFASCSNAWHTGEWAIQQEEPGFMTTLVMFALLLKLGLAPMHTWLPEVLQGVDIRIALLLSTWQKLAPLVLLMQVTPENSQVTVYCGLLSILTAGWAGANQTQLRKLLAYSSIAHLGWIVMVIPYSPSVAMLGTALYIATSIAVFTILDSFEATTINSLTNAAMDMPMLIMAAYFVLFSLGSLPPLTGFMPKWLIMDEMAKQELAPLLTLASLASLLGVFYYSRLIYISTLTMPPNTIAGAPPWRLTSSKPTLAATIFTTVTLFLLPVTPLVATLISMNL
uniref:NADH dehydrogenase subunit 2 n=1 Tax=Parupeneus barberinoides TaxID=586843 RepID=UPI00279CB304|nr:NADH dehydrogenase subunit 2 [Parupeneus barberinoides]WGO62561.1 NADH dehydrogenase subunit 2 [Parupeneus barberinoides]